MYIKVCKCYSTFTQHWSFNLFYRLIFDSDRQLLFFAFWADGELQSSFCDFYDFNNFFDQVLCPFLWYCKDCHVSWQPSQSCSESDPDLWLWRAEATELMVSNCVGGADLTPIQGIEKYWHRPSFFLLATFILSKHGRCDSYLRNLKTLPTHSLTGRGGW